MDSFIERCAGLDVHKASVKAYGRIPDGHGGRHSETRTFRTTTAGLVLLGDWLASHQIRGDGVHRGVLEAGLLPAGGRRRVLAAERPAPQERARVMGLPPSWSVLWRWLRLRDVVTVSRFRIQAWTRRFT